MMSGFVPLANVKVERSQWAVPNLIPGGEFTVGVGDPASGKSALAYDLTARITTGGQAPLSESRCAVGGVIIISTEESAARSIRPKLAAAGADVDRVLYWDRRHGPFDLSRDLRDLEDSVSQINARLVVLDPLSSILGSPSSDSQTRIAMESLAAFAERTGAAVFGIRHFTKSTGRSRICRGAGSMAISAVARLELAVVNDSQPNDPFRRVIVPVKASLATPKCLAFRTVPREGSVGIEWIGTCDYKSDLIVDTKEENRTARHEAEFFLYIMLQNGPVMANDIYKAAVNAGIAKRTLDRAKRSTGVISRLRGSGRRMNWLWTLPSDQASLQPFKDRLINELTDDLCHGVDMPADTGCDDCPDDGGDEGASV